MEDQGALHDAGTWIIDLLQGPIAVSFAVIAIGGLGILLLQGRLPVRRGMTVILGCFLLFGAPAIARGLLLSSALVGAPAQVAEQPVIQLPAFEVPIGRKEVPQVESDPYAGASVAR